MALVDASPQGGFRQISSFKIPDGMKKSWAHPVISGGLLYLRGKDKILCYDVRDPNRAAAAAPVAPVAPVKRLWKDSTGKFQVEATFKGMRSGNAVLQKNDGSIIQVPFNRFSAADQAYLRGL